MGSKHTIFRHDILHDVVQIIIGYVFAPPSVFVRYVNSAGEADCWDTGLHKVKERLVLLSVLVNRMAHFQQASLQQTERCCTAMDCSWRLVAVPQTDCSPYVLGSETYLLAVKVSDRHFVHYPSDFLALH